MNRIDRLNAILTHLQSKKVVTAAEIAERFEISLRTVYRDIRALESGGVPVGAEAGKGYFLMPGYHLPPVMFTKEEAASLLTGFKLIEKMSDKSTGKYFDSALYKIKSVLNSSEKEYLEALNSSMEVYKFSPVSESDKNEISMQEIQEALIKSRVLKIKYFSGYQMQKTFREIEPIGICYYGSNWHLIAFCRLRKDYRDFRIDRILELKKEDETFNPKHHKSLKEYTKQFSSEKDFNRIIVRMTLEAVKYMGEHKYFWGFVHQEEKDGMVEMTFINPYPEGFARWMLMFGNSVKIVEPEEMVLSIKNLVKELKEYYLDS